MKKSVVRDTKGNPKIDPELADLEWRANTDPAKKPVSVKSEPDLEAGPAISRDPDAYPIGIPAFEESRARKEAFAAAMAELDYEKACGKLVDAEAVRKATFETARTIRNALQVLPARISPIVASMEDVHEVRTYLQLEIDRVLLDLASRIGGSADASEPDAPCD